MTSRSLLISTIVAATAAFAFSGAALSAPDAQAQAASLLSRPHTSERLQTQPSASKSLDAHASAAALLTGRTTSKHVPVSTSVTSPAVARQQADAQAQAAALLSS